MGFILSFLLKSPRAALSVGIFPYVLKLLQSSARELRPLLVFIWAKILAVDSSCQADLVKDNGHKYFLSVLADPYMPAEHRTMAVFILAVIVNNYNTGQELVVALSHLVVQYESNFCTVALQFMEEEKNYAAPSPANTTEAGNVTPVRERDSPAVPRLRPVNSYTNIRAASSARNLNKSLQNLNLNEEGESHTQSIHPLFTF
ncbi:hypothetical protein PDJAM_G00114210 [Pangasius djambal]|uniref:Uncharacterized protein n=1 Tax=Pangasius djambal TaxID=1691987 RepID=A0ACC5Y2K1_9TELE|nr:hypothetical protein [Pangasius djambal]